MRKSNSERKAKRITNELGEFYLYYVNKERVKKEVLSKTNSQVKDLPSRVKMATELLYSNLKVEEKYKYYINLYILYLIICRYFETDNDLIEKFFKKKNVKTFKVLEIKLPYEAAFGTLIKDKANDCVNWLYYSLKKIVENYISMVKKENIKKLANEIEDYDKEILNNLLKQYENTEYFDEIRLLNHILARIQYARDNIEVLYGVESEKSKLKDKKLKAMVKGALTRTEKLINMVINDVKSIA